MLKHSMPVESTGAAAGRLAESGAVRIDQVVVDEGDGAAFRAELARQTVAADGAGPRGLAPFAPLSTERAGLGEHILGRASTLAEEMQGDQQYVSRLLETATRSGEPLHLMKAVAAMNDYQTRVQFVSKVVSKAATSIDQLTKLQ